MKILKILFSFFILFFSFFVNAWEISLTKQESIIQEIESARVILMNINNWESYINKIDFLIENIKANQIRLKVTNNKLNVILSKIKNISDKNAQDVRIIIKYFLKKIEKELPIISVENIDSKHLETPEVVKSLYYTSYSGWSKDKIDKLINLAKKTEINSVTIDIKEVDWYVAFDMSGFKFDNIKPTSNDRIPDIKNLIKTLHENNIYIIWRLTVFKDKLLAEEHPELAIKWEWKNDVWTDYNWNKYLDPYSKEVWKYTMNLSRAAYELWFDEINYDYVRFPSDWIISKTYYPFANVIEANNPKWWKIIVIDKFSNYITSELRSKFPNIKLSADVFWLVTNSDLFNIWQNLESFLLYFDYIWPMVYPSHYSVNTLNFSVPDNYPYEIIKNALNNTNKRIDNLNILIKTAKTEQAKIKIKDAFFAEKNVNNLENIPKNKIRPWLQWFTCTRCEWATIYNSTKFKKEVNAVIDSWLNSWWVWNSSSNYDIDWFN